MHPSPGFFAFLFFGLLAGTAGAQPQPVASEASATTVFLDCRTDCDQDFIRTEITFVDWVRERAVADVHVLITGQSAGAGGQAYTVTFLGLRTLAGRGDTLLYTSTPTTTPDERRRALTQVISLGLVQFVARRAGASSLRVSQTPAAGGEPDRAPAAHDPWRSWVFAVRLNGRTSGERAYSSGEINGIHDQIYLPKEQGSTVDVLLRRRALLTGFQYYLQVGLSYTFGSIFNNVVNPRF